MSTSAVDKSQKRKLAEERRLKALADKRALHKRQKVAPRGISIAVPPAGSHKRLVFDSDSDDDGMDTAGQAASAQSSATTSIVTATQPQRQTSQQVAARVRKDWIGSDSDSSSDSEDGEDASDAQSATAKKLSVFGSDSEDDSSDDDEGDGNDDLARHFRVRPEFEGAAGKRLLDLQRRIADPRFEFDSRFADSMDSVEDQSAEDVDIQKSSAEKDGEVPARRVEDENVHSLALLGSLFDGIQNLTAPKAPDDSDVYGSGNARGTVPDARHVFGKMVQQTRFDPSSLDDSNGNVSKAGSGSKSGVDNTMATNIVLSSKDGSSTSNGKSSRKASTSAPGTAVTTITATDGDVHEHSFKVKSGWSNLFDRSGGAGSTGAKDHRQVVPVTTEELERGGKSTTDEHREAYVQANKQDPILFSFDFDVEGSAGSKEAASSSAVVAAFDADGADQATAILEAEKAKGGQVGQKYRNILEYGCVVVRCDCAMHLMFVQHHFVLLVWSLLLQAIYVGYGYTTDAGR